MNWGQEVHRLHQQRCAQSLVSTSQQTRPGGLVDTVELKLNALQRQCLDRRLRDLTTMEREVARVDVRKAFPPKSPGHFTTADARIKLKRLQPVLQE